MRLGIDLDGVTADMVTTAGELYGFDPQDIDSWNGIFDKSGLTPWQFWRQARRNGLFLKAAPMEGAVDAIKRLQEKHEIVFVTHRPDWALCETIMWLDEHFGDMERELHFEERKSDTECDVYLDDAPHVLDALYQEEVPYYVVRFSQPWNADCKTWDFTVPDWHSFEYLVNCIGGGWPEGAEASVTDGGCINGS